MTTIWKFPVEIKGEVKIQMPKFARILSVQMQGSTPCIWAVVDTAYATEQRTFRVFGTGHPVPDTHATTLTFIGTVQVGRLVFHIFES